MNIAARQPILVRELRQASRRRRTPWFLAALTILLTLTMVSVVVCSGDVPLHVVGATLYRTFFTVAACVVVLVGATVSANGFTSEHEGHTWEALLLSGLSPGALTTGKFLAAYTQVATYLVVIAPVLALSFLVGGVTVAELVVGLGLLFALAALAVAFGLAMSSLVTTARSALVATVLATLLLGPVVYGLFLGAGMAYLSLAGDDTDIGTSWLALGLARGPFGLRYVSMLVVDPLLALALPGWFLFEVTRSNVAGAGADRSTGLRRWFVIATPLLAGATLPTLAIVTTAAARDSVLGGSLLLVACHLGFSALVFAGEPLVPQRRVVAAWSRTGGETLLRRALGPGIGRAVIVQAVVGTATLGALTAVGAAVGSPSAGTLIVLSGLYAMGFHLFVVGVAGTVAVRSGRPMFARLVVLVVVAALVVVPLGIEAAVRAGTGSISAGLLAALSPLYPVVVDRSVSAGFVAAMGYVVLGALLVVLTPIAARRRR